jgi:predicted DCC family thiol-disulfide oxidoreductase YuxK
VNERSRPLLIYDGNCDFCLQWISRWREMTGEKVEYQPYQEIAHFYPDIGLERFEEAVQLIDTDGQVLSGAAAVMRVLEASGARRWRLARWLMCKIPGASVAAERAYSWIAARRTTASALTRFLWADELMRPQYHIVRWVFLRGLGLIYLIAIASLWSQLIGLVGAEGIRPAEQTLAAAAEHFGAARFWRFPTLFWINASDNALNLLSCLGCIGALGLIMNRRPRFFAILCWLTYLSLYTIGGEFLRFQWDILLLETGLLGILAAQGDLRPRFELEKPIPRVVILLLRWLLFRLMFMSGVVKLASGDASWWNLSALAYHYESQPLPMATSWYMHQLPLIFHRISCLGMFFIELIVPFFIFAPRGPRAIAAVIFIWFQLLIIATGNYAFFNWLTILLCVSLFDDSYLSRFVKPHFLVSKAGRLYGRDLTARDRFMYACVAFALVALSSAHMLGRFFSYRQLPRWTREAIEWTNPYHPASAYGLFAVMTKGRREIIIEGSNDGKEWRSYEFRYKPGDVERRPPTVAPHQPRLDWQMWFAALGDYRQNPWLIAFMRRLLEGSEPVLALLADNPFPDAPPRHVRAMIWDYRFTRADVDTDAWWEREHPKAYTPVLSAR